MEISISKHLQDQLGIPDAIPGKKCKCPVCGHDNFSIKKDDTLVKCFNPYCGEFITTKMLDDTPKASLARILYQFYKATHSELLKGNNLAYKYLIEARKIHSKIIAESMMGVVPSEYDVSSLFKEPLTKFEQQLRELEQNRSEAKRKKEIEPIERAIENVKNSMADINEVEEKIKQIVTRYIGRLIFYHTDSSLNITRLRLREPFSKKFVTFVFDDSISGVFGANFSSIDEGSEKLPLIVLEGEVNLLRVQSAHMFCMETEGIDLDNVGYFNAISLGSANSPDYETVMNLDSQPVYSYDNDDSGISVVANALEHMHCSSFTVPEPHKDIDEYINSFGDDYSAALEAITDLVVARKFYYRNYDAVAEEIKNIRRSDFIKEFEINRKVADEVLNDLRSRCTFLNDGKTPYLFNKETNKLHDIHRDNLDQIKLLYNFKLNHSESIFKFVTNEMVMEAFNQGIESNIYRFSYYDKGSNTMYIYDNNGSIYKLTRNTIDLVPNGTERVLFIHNPNAEPFVLSESEYRRGVFFEKLIKSINLDDSEENKFGVSDLQELIKYWVIGIYFESIMPTKAIAAFLGERGSGKSTFFKKLGIALFGKDFDVMNVPEKPDDLDIAMLQETLITLDNADSKVSWLEDRLATSATGSKIKKRKLYTDKESIELKPHCFVGITSRNPHFRRDDVAERTLIFKVKRLEKFIPESEILADVYENRNEILTDLILTIQNILNTIDSASGYSGDVRMADFANFMVKAATAEGKDVQAEMILQKLPSMQAEFAVEVDPLIDLLAEWSERNSGRKVTYEELCEELGKIADDRKMQFYFRGNHRSFANKIASMKSTLSKIFEIVEESKGSHVKVRSFKLKEDTGYKR
jgi:hypothetical protein